MKETPTLQREQLMSVGEVTRELNVSRSHVYGLMQKGELAYVEVGGVRRVKPSELDRYVSSQTRGGGSE